MTAKCHWTCQPVFKSRSGAFVLSDACAVPGRLSFTLTTSARIRCSGCLPRSRGTSHRLLAGPNLIISLLWIHILGCESACHPSTVVAAPVVKFDYALHTSHNIRLGSACSLLTRAGAQVKTSMASVVSSLCTWQVHVGSIYRQVTPITSLAMFCGR